MLQQRCSSVCPATQFSNGRASEWPRRAGAVQRRGGKGRKACARLSSTLESRTAKKELSRRDSLSGGWRRRSTLATINVRTSQLALHAARRAPCAAKLLPSSKTASWKASKTNLRSVRMRRKSCLAERCLYLKNPAPQSSAYVAYDSAYKGCFLVRQLWYHWNMERGFH